MPKSKRNFTQSFEELEKIVAKFEGEKIDLDEALEEFEQGLKLVQELKGRLTEVENKVTVLKKKFGASDSSTGSSDDDVRNDVNL